MLFTSTKIRPHRSTRVITRIFGVVSRTYPEKKTRCPSASDHRSLCVVVCVCVCVLSAPSVFHFVFINCPSRAPSRPRSPECRPAATSRGGECGCTPTAQPSGHSCCSHQRLVCHAHPLQSNFLTLFSVAARTRDHTTTPNL